MVAAMFPWQNETMDKKNNTLDADPELIRRVEALVAETRRSREEIINDALRSYLDWHEDFVRSVSEGLEAADRGDFASPEEVERVLDKYRPT